MHSRVLPKDAWLLFTGPGGDNKCFKLPTLHCREQGATVPGVPFCRSSSDLFPRENSPNLEKCFIKRSSSILCGCCFISPILYSEHLFLRVKLHIFFKARTVTPIFCSHQIIFPVNREAAPLLSLLPAMGFTPCFGGQPFTAKLSSCCSILKLINPQELQLRSSSSALTL